MFLAENKCKEEVFTELTAPLLASLICGNKHILFVTIHILFNWYFAFKSKPPFYFCYNSDPESFVQEQALAFARNLIDGCIDSVEYMFAEDGIIFDAVGRQLKSLSKAEIAIQVRSLFSGKVEMIFGNLIFIKNDKAECLIRFFFFLWVVLLLIQSVTSYLRNHTWENIRYLSGLLF